jgi:hypothetical protein
MCSTFCDLSLLRVMSLCSLYLKAKAVPLHATKALGGKKVYLLLFLDLGTRWGRVLFVPSSKISNCLADIPDAIFFINRTAIIFVLCTGAGTIHYF